MPEISNATLVSAVSGTLALLMWILESFQNSPKAKLALRVTSFVLVISGLSGVIISMNDESKNQIDDLKQKNAILSLQNKNLLLEKEISSVHSSLRQEKKRIKKLVAKVSVIVDGIWTDSTIPFSVNVIPVPTQDTEILQFRSVTGAIPELRMRLSEHYQIMEIRPGMTFIFKGKVTALPDSFVLLADSDNLDRYSEVVISVPTVGWGTQNLADLNVRSIQIEIDINNDHTIVISKKIDQWFAPSYTRAGTPSPDQHFLRFSVRLTKNDVVHLPARKN